MINLDGTPYLIADNSSIFARCNELQERVELLREEGSLSETTLRAHFGDTRFEQIAESNGIEGSTLSVNETQLAVLQGVTISGHDPAYARDARNLSLALDQIVELARLRTETDIQQVLKVHQLVLGDRPGAGSLRTEPIRISGSEHHPPKTWGQVMSDMEQWERWSLENPSAPTILRAVVLHTWLTHIHPFLDGNGRTARAILNLELIRSGYPSVIIRRKERQRYYNALSESDAGGDLSEIAELVTERTGHALQALERVAKSTEGYDAIQARLRKSVGQRAYIWNSSVQLLYSLIMDSLKTAYGNLGQVVGRWLDSDLSVDDYQALENANSGGNTWSFIVTVSIPGGGKAEYLAWIGFRSTEMKQAMEGRPGPSLFWSRKQEDGPHRWVQAGPEAPGGVEFSLQVPNVDKWLVRRYGGGIALYFPSEIAHKIVCDIDSNISDE